MAHATPLSENASEAICGRDASRADMHGRKLSETMLKTRIDTEVAIQANREMKSMAFGDQVL